MDYENENVNDIESVEVLKNEASISLIARSEIEAQVSTARKYPRSIKAFMNRALSIATVNEDVADSCEYALPRGNKTLQGPSVRLAEIVVGAYGNIRAGMRVIHNDGITITAQGICHDLETNTCVTLEVKRSILQNEYAPSPTDPSKRVRTGKMVTMTEDMQVVTGNAACAIAFRNAVFKVIPSALIQEIYDKTKKVAKGTLETLPARRTKTLEYLHGLGVKDEQICLAVEVRSVDDIDLEKLALLRGMCTSIRNQEATVNEVFPIPEPKRKSERATNATEDAIKQATNKANGKTKGTEPPPGEMPA